MGSTGSFYLGNMLKQEYPKPEHAGYSVSKITNGYILHTNNVGTYYKTKKQVAAAILKHMQKELA